MDIQDFDLSIIVVAFHNPAALRLCLRSILSDTPQCIFEVIVVDSDANRYTKDVALEECASHDHFQYIPFYYNCGFPKGVNAGLKTARGRNILILNFDIVLTPHAIERMSEYMDAHPDVGLLGPMLKNFNETWQQSLFRFYTLSVILARRSILGRLHWFRRRLESFLMKGIDPNQTQTPGWLMGSALMTRKTMVEKVGFMDERFFMYFEDVDWARRFWHNGYIVCYFPSAVMYHYHGQGSKTVGGLIDAAINPKTRWHIMSALKFFWKYHNLKNLFPRRF